MTTVAYKLPKLKTQVIESDPYKAVCIVSTDYMGSLILAECNGSGKNEVANEIVKRCNSYNSMVERIAELEILLNLR